ncbi:MAG: hypothetical protein JKX97_00705 [Candidatus Lindowbacteria bacterium]|nr:hypothetical protein [Candidatus Lindowbacteria bacterium]
MKKNIATLIVAISSLAVLPISANACTVCFGDPNSAMTQGMEMAIWTLLGCIVTVLAAIAGMAYYFVRRSIRVNGRTDLNLEILNDSNEVTP